MFLSLPFHYGFGAHVTESLKRHERHCSLVTSLKRRRKQSNILKRHVVQAPQCLLPQSTPRKYLVLVAGCSIARAIVTEPSAISPDLFTVEPAMASPSDPSNQ